ncbi:short-chain dehydrogenase [Rhizodiscina lignyota]|uniref:Short-chain dehydrogenase n=1 Tax=Rhizodiscina lignyota TaxID=1504668 RepID=A0A9P4MBV3_9PEZI|nr:short-chain dehydrogenase [Rhizodiscina lignyota]
MASSLESSTLFRVDGMVAVITGGGTGIGLTMARALALNGARKVYILGRRLEVLKTAAQEHPSLTPIQCDATSKEALQAAVDQITVEVGYVNLLISNAGSITELRKSLFTDFAMEGMNETLQLNVTAPFFTMTAFLELLDAGNKNALKGGFGKPIQQGSHVPAIQSQCIFTSSIAAFSRHWTSTAPYVASKAANMQVVKYASTQLARFGIRVNAIAPRLYPSEMASGLIGSRNPETELMDHPQFLPSKRFGGDEEMAGAILYLSSRTGGYSNGSILITDGGRLSIIPATY